MPNTCTTGKSPPQEEKDSHCTIPREDMTPLPLWVENEKDFMDLFEGRSRSPALHLTTSFDCSVWGDKDSVTKPHQQPPNANQTQKVLEHCATKQRIAPDRRHKRASSTASDSSSSNTKPKRPLTAYNLFFKSKHSELLSGDTNKTLTFSKIGKQIGKLWQEIHASDKAEYDRLAKQDQLRYRQEMAVWKKEQRKRRLRTNISHLKQADRTDENNRTSSAPPTTAYSPEIPGAPPRDRNSPYRQSPSQPPPTSISPHHHPISQQPNPPATLPFDPYYPPPPPGHHFYAYRRKPPPSYTAGNEARPSVGDGTQHSRRGRSPFTAPFYSHYPHQHHDSQYDAFDRTQHPGQPAYNYYNNMREHQPAVLHHHQLPLQPPSDPRWLWATSPPDGGYYAPPHSPPMAGGAKTSSESSALPSPHHRYQHSPGDTITTAGSSSCAPSTPSSIHMAQSTPSFYDNHHKEEGQQQHQWMPLPPSSEQHVVAHHDCSYPARTSNSSSPAHVRKNSPSQHRHLPPASPSSHSHARQHHSHLDEGNRATPRHDLSRPSFHR
ncbi:hypothetical protein ACA910_013954 [Epithemia clementina (nom. ined.)]